MHLFLILCLALTQTSQKIGKPSAVLGSDTVSSMLTVFHRRSLHSHHLAKNRGVQSAPVIMHDHGGSMNIVCHPQQQWPIDHHRTSCHMILKQKLFQSLFSSDLRHYTHGRCNDITPVIHNLQIRVYQNRDTTSHQDMFLPEHGLHGHEDFFRFPDIILITAHHVVCFLICRIRKQKCKVIFGTSARRLIDCDLHILRYFGRKHPQNIHGTVLTVVIAHQKPPVFILLRPDGLQKLRQILFSLAGRQQNGHHWLFFTHDLTPLFLSPDSVPGSLLPLPGHLSSPVLQLVQKICHPDGQKILS